MKHLIQTVVNLRNFPVAFISSVRGSNRSADLPRQSPAQLKSSKRNVTFESTMSHPSRQFPNALAILFTCIALWNATPLTAQVSITANVTKEPFQVLAGSTRQINVNIAGGTQKTVNWSVLSTTGGASATFTTPNGADVSSVTGALPTVQVNIGPTQGNCTITGSGSYSVTSTASVTVQAQSTDDPTKTASFLFNVCANSPPTLDNGTSSVIVAPAYQQAYQNQPMTLQSWVMGCTNETGTWSIVTQPSGGNGTLSDTNYRDVVFTASVTGRYMLKYTANCNSGGGTAIVYVSPNPMPSYATTPNGTRPHECYVDPELSGADYEVGAGKAYSTISSTPALTGFKPGTIVRIWNTDTTGTNPSVYHEYYNIQTSGTATQPILVCGVPDSMGNLPIMDGTDAKAQSDVDTSAGGGIITIWKGPGHYGYWQGGSLGPNYVSITGLHLRNGKSNIKKYSPGSSTETNWDNFTACVNARSGSYVDISGNHLDNCSNGIFTANNGNNAWATITQNFSIMGNHVDLSGDPNYPETTHQMYLQTYYLLLEGNRLDNPSQYVGCQVKWRGIEGIFRYNYLGDGAERLFDLVENQDGAQYMMFDPYFELYGYGDRAGANVVAAYQESFQKDFIYGNVMFGSSAEAQIHYADDQGLAQMSNRNGILHFYSNTIDNAQLVFDNGEWGMAGNTYYQARIDARNNILWARSTAWTGVINMAFATTPAIILDAKTNLMRAGTFSIQTPIMGETGQSPAGTGWRSVCDPSPCAWPLQVPIDPHLYGLSAANYLSTSTQPYDSSTLVPLNGSAAVGAGTALDGNPLSYMPVRWQYSIATGALALRRDPLTIGAEDSSEGSVPTAATPTFSPSSGTYSTTQTVLISSSTPGATIYYTTDGSTPTTGSQSYSGPITVSASETLSAIAVATGYNNSPVGSASYVITLGQVAAPIFNPAGGTYTSTQQVSISTTTAGATIYYTTNGQTPTTSSTVYSGPITVSSTTTVSALAVLSGYTDSPVATATYTINTDQVATPIFSPAPGTYATAQNVTISTTTPSATIYYTTDGSTPTTGSAVYSGPISVTASETIKAIATASSLTTSAVATATYTIGPSPAATPRFSPSPGYYPSALNVTISTTTPSATIYYTTNGSTPTTSSTVYTGPINVTATMTIKAIAAATGYSASAVATGTYTIRQSRVSTPTFTPGPGNYTSAQGVAISTTTPSAAIHYTTDGSTPTSSSTLYTAPIVVTTTQTIKAIAVASGYMNSVVAMATYTITPATVGQAATPYFTPNAGTYTSAQTVTISTTTPSATIRYTTNGGTPTPSSLLYSGPISVSTSQTIKAIAIASGYSTSAVASATYTINITSNADFSISASPTSLTVATGSNGTTTVSVVPQNGFNANVTFACSGLPSGTACSFAPASVTPSGGPASTVLTISKTSNTASQQSQSPFIPGSMFAVAFCFIGWKKRRRLQMLALLIVGAAGILAMNGCGGATFKSTTSSSGTTSMVTITATSGAIEHSTTVSVTVN